MFHAHDERSVVDSCELEFTCEKCHETTSSDAYQFKTVSKAYGFIPIWVSHETALKCLNCGVTFRTKIAPSELVHLSSEQLASSFHIRIGFIEKFLVVTGWLFFFTGPVSLIMFLVAYFKLQKAAAGWRRASAIGILISSIFTIFIVISIIFAD